MNIKYKQIIVIAIASIMIFSGFLILISQSSSPLEKNKKIIFNDISSSNVNYNFSFLNSNNYNKSGIIITNNSIWYYSTVNYSVCGENLQTGQDYKFLNTLPIYRNQIQFDYELNYVYWLEPISATNVLKQIIVNYVNLNTFSETSYIWNEYTNGTIYSGGIVLTNIGISSVVSSDNVTNSWVTYMFTTNFTNNATLYIGNSPYRMNLEGQSNMILNLTYYQGPIFNYSVQSAIPTGNLYNFIQINKNLFSELVSPSSTSTNIMNFSSKTFSGTTGYLYYIPDVYFTNQIIPSLQYEYYNMSNSTLILPNVFIKLTNLLQISSLDFSPQFYLNTNYQISYTANFIININSFSGQGTQISNYYLYKGQITTKSYLNNSLTLNILPLNYSVYLWTKGHIIITQNDYTSKNGVNYYYNISIYYSSTAPTFQNPYNLTSYIFPMSVMLFLILGGIIIYGKFKYGGKFQWT